MVGEELLELIVVLAETSSVVVTEAVVTGETSFVVVVDRVELVETEGTIVEVVASVVVVLLSAISEVVEKSRLVELVGETLWCWCFGQSPQSRAGKLTSAARA
jgi:hypothetical protein